MTQAYDNSQKSHFREYSNKRDMRLQWQDRWEILEDDIYSCDDDDDDDDDDEGQEINEWSCLNTCIFSVPLNVNNDCFYDHHVEKYANHDKTA